MLHKDKPDYFLARVNDCKRLLCEDGELADYFFGVVVLAADIYKIKDCDDEFFAYLEREIKIASSKIR
jgi:hypothetical protein